MDEHKGGEGNGDDAFDIKGLLSDEGKRRKPGLLMKIVHEFVGREGFVGMHGGLPPADSFPINSVQLSLANPVEDAFQHSTAPITVVLDDPAELARHQQYRMSLMGHPPLRSWLLDLMQRLHKPARPDVMVATANGATHSVESIMRLLLNPGDAVLVEEFVFSQVLDALIEPMGLQAIGVPMDEQGLLPEDLEAAIVAAAEAGKRPRVLYTIPMGQNPTGANMGLRRKQAVYDVCNRHNVLIIEDDPYYYLQYPASSSEVPGLALEPGFLHFDTAGRVVRVDTFAKCMAPGLRLGWLTAAKGTLEPIMNAVVSGTMGPASTSEMLAHATLKAWGPEGFEAHVRRLQELYRSKAEVLHEALQLHCSEAATWVKPEAGMFFWLRLHGCRDAVDLVPEMRTQQVIGAPGRIFHVSGKSDAFESNCMRLAFANATDEDLKLGAVRLGKVLQAVAAGQSKDT